MCGKKFLCAKLHHPQIRSSTKDSHFTVLDFTSATGVPLMCSIIFAAKEMEVNWVLGLDADEDGMAMKTTLKQTVDEGNDIQWDQHALTMA